jgi:isopentenyl-diphosphate delta-isomerase
MSSSKNIHDIESRKGDHIRLCLEEDSQANYSVFDKYRLPYTSLPEFDLKDVDTSVDLLGTTLEMPLILASMTGGSEHGRTINKNLAIAAERCGIAMGLGSQRIGLEKIDARDTFELARKHAPNAFLIANMGAVQLNYGHTVESYIEVVKMIDADALYLHLNPLQEALQPGGDTNFTGLVAKIKDLVSKVGVPVIVKEVGHGISASDAIKLIEAGVRGIDVAGVGGTSYAWVESERAKNKHFSDWFKDYGIQTDKAVIDIAKVASDDTVLIASGGVRGPVDGLKSRALGADLFSAAVPFLEAAMEEKPDKLIELIENWKKGISIAMFASGVKNWDEAKRLQLIKE